MLYGFYYTEDSYNKCQKYYGCHIWASYVKSLVQRNLFIVNKNVYTNKLFVSCNKNFVCRSQNYICLVEVNMIKIYRCRSLKVPIGNPFRAIVVLIFCTANLNFCCCQWCSLEWYIVQLKVPTFLQYTGRCCYYSCCRYCVFGFYVCLFVCRIYYYCWHDELRERTCCIFTVLFF